MESQRKRGRPRKEPQEAVVRRGGRKPNPERAKAMKAQRERTKARQERYARELVLEKRDIVQQLSSDKRHVALESKLNEIVVQAKNNLPAPAVEESLNPIEKFNLSENRDIIGDILKSALPASEQGKHIKRQLQKLRSTDTRDGQMTYFTEVLYNLMGQGASVVEIAETLGLGIAQTKAYIKEARKADAESTLRGLNGNVFLNENLKANKMIQVMSGRVASMEFNKLVRMNEDPDFIVNKINELKEAGLKYSDIKIYLQSMIPDARLLADSMKQLDAAIGTASKMLRDLNVGNLAPVDLAEVQEDKKTIAQKAEEIKRELTLNFDDEEEGDCLDVEPN